MATPLITASDYPAIRAALGFGITAKQIPDSLIDLQPYAPSGINDVLRRDPIAETRTGPKGDAVKLAAILFTASYLALIAQTVKTEKEGDITLTYEDSISPQALHESLRLRATSEIDAVLTSIDVRPVMFSTVSARRGR